MELGAIPSKPYARPALVSERDSGPLKSRAQYGNRCLARFHAFLLRLSNGDDANACQLGELFWCPIQETA